MKKFTEDSFCTGLCCFQVYCFKFIVKTFIYLGHIANFWTNDWKKHSKIYVEIQVMSDMLWNSIIV